MFIRKTRSNAKAKTPSINFQLVESVRTERGPRQRILLNLGTGLDLDDINLKSLANRIEEILKGINTLLPYSEKIENLAQKYARKVQQQMAANNQAVEETSSNAANNPPDFHTVDVNTLKQEDSRTVGAEHLMLHMVNQLQLKSKLQELGLSKKEIFLALGTIIGRAVFPASERATQEWLQERSGIGELLNFDFQNTSLDQLYRVGDILLKNKQSIEQHLAQTAKQLHGLPSIMALYDLTNTYMQGQSKQNPKALHGVSKEKRTDCPLVTLGLVIDEHGFAQRSSFLPGNVSEPETLQMAIEQLGIQETLVRPIIVLDAGIASEDNLRWLRQQGYRYVVSARQKAPSMELEGDLVSAQARTAEVSVAYVRTENQEEKWLYCESKAKEAVASKMRQLFQERFESALTRLSEGIQKPRGRRNYLKVVERLGRLKEKHRQVSGCYDVIVHPSEDGKEAAQVTWSLIQKKIEARLNGYYFLRTNILDLDAPALWRLYGNLRTVEDAFRFMKSSLGMRPVYHQKEKRVEGHLWITVLAYHLIKGCLHVLSKNGVSDTWETVRNNLSNRTRITLQAKRGDGKTLYHRSTAKSTSIHDRIYNALGISSQISKTRKMIL
jgi:transposase